MPRSCLTAASTATSGRPTAATILLMPSIQRLTPAAISSKNPEHGNHPGHSAAQGGASARRPDDRQLRRRSPGASEDHPPDDRQGAGPKGQGGGVHLPAASGD